MFYPIILHKKTPMVLNTPTHTHMHTHSDSIQISHIKNVSKLHGESFHLRPLPSRFHNSRQFSSSPLSYWKLFGSPAFQLVKVIGCPVAIQKKLPSSARSVPDTQKCSWPRPVWRREWEKFFLWRIRFLCRCRGTETMDRWSYSMRRGAWWWERGS